MNSDLMIVTDVSLMKLGKSDNPWLDEFTMTHHRSQIHRSQILAESSMTGHEAIFTWQF